MTKYEKLKVVELKEECKARDISITGLKLKQQYIDKLVEYDSASQDATLAEESVEDRTNGAFEEVEKNEIPEPSHASTTPPDDATSEGQKNGDAQVDATEDIPLAVEMDKNLPSDRPIALKVEDSQDSIGDPGDDVPTADTVQEAKDIKRDDMLIPEPEQIETTNEAPTEPQAQEEGQAEDVKMSDAEVEQPPQLEKEPTPTPIVDKPDTAARDDSPLKDDLRKRKRRSATPPPNAQEVRKKAKGEHGGAIITSTTPLKSGSPSPDRPEKHTTQDGSESAPKVAPKHSEEPVQQQEQPKAENDSKHRSPTPVMDDDRLTEPAMHAATRSLYMRNFKRPLNVPTLRSHVSTIAQGTSSVSSDEDVIKFWYMNNIRSHALVTFTNIAAASRVRTAMHQSRFPDEPQREPLWIDFVPDDKVEGWVEQETGSSRGQRNSGAKYEVAYYDTGEGFEAVFQEVGAGRGSTQRPGISTMSTNRSSLSQRQLSYSADPSRTATVASGIHPDRAPLVPQEPEERGRSSPAAIATPAKPHADQGKGFGALDDLFSYTSAKPKLYFKKVAQDIIDDRLDMIQDLYPDRGVSGDAGMKRYTFEKQSGREEWVDNGPEFGHGKRGQDRLAGLSGRGRGGFRGRGGRGGGDRGSFAGDSYRGAGRR